MREFGDVEISIEESDEFSLDLAHDWPTAVAATEVDELNQAIIEGLIRGFSTSLGLASLGCRVKTVTAIYQEGISPMTVRLAAMLAASDVLARATWTLECGPFPNIA